MVAVGALRCSAVLNRTSTGNHVEPYPSLLPKNGTVVNENCTKLDIRINYAMRILCILIAGMLTASCSGESTQSSKDASFTLRRVPFSQGGEFALEGHHSFEAIASVAGRFHIRFGDRDIDLNSEMAPRSLSLAAAANEAVVFSFSERVTPGDKILEQYVAPLGGENAIKALAQAVPQFGSGEVQEYILRQASTGTSSQWVVALPKKISAREWQTHSSKIPISEVALLATWANADSEGHIPAHHIKNRSVVVENSKGDLYLLYVYFEPT